MASAKVLLVDDDVELLDLLASYLERDGFEVAAACDAESGVAAALSGSHQLVALDVMMPRMTGIEALGGFGRRAASRLSC